ncbi:MAG: hypothetical protein QOE33_2518 [Acidobacteriota bacterium]|nr:hypothetical protein [Acidobacteriota bacterium]
MEEGGKATYSEVVRQIELWDKWGQKELIDVIKYAHEMGIYQWYGEKPKLQPTWRNLIRVFLTAEGQFSDNETMRHYQKTSWRTQSGETCLMELLPLPSPDATSWLYGEISTLPYLKNRETYEKYIVGSRIAHLKDRITHYKPKAVIFYGTSYDNHWKKVVGISSWEKSPEGINYAVNNSTIFIATKL